MRSTQSNKEAGQRRQRTVEERAEVMGRYVESGQTQRVFAQGEGIGVSTLQLWLRQVSATGEAASDQSAKGRRGGAVESISLLEVELGRERSPARCGEATGYEVELRCGTRLRLGAGFVEREVRQLLALLQEVD